MDKSSWVLSFFSKSKDVSSGGELIAFPTPGESKRRDLSLLLQSPKVANDGCSEQVQQIHVSQEVSTQDSSVVPYSREYWMPDKLCRTCYECELPFSMFRRKHHCRFCGQIFCHSCSSHFVDGRPLTLVGMVRACKLCQTQVSKNTLALAPPSKPVSQEDESEIAEVSRVESGCVRACSAHKNSDMLSFRTHSHEFNPSAARLQPSIVSAELLGCPRLSSESHADPMCAVGGPLNHGIPWPNRVSDLQKSMSYNVVCARQMHWTTSSWLQRVVDHLLRSEWTMQQDLCQSWNSIVFGLIQQVCTSINPNIHLSRDSMDVRPYVKIKTIPGGSALECCYLDGVVFKKEIVHKLMRKSASKPRILLIAGGVEFQRMKSKLASFSILTEQEEKYTQIIVDKIVRLRPHLLLVGQSISRQAQECLRQHDVVAMQHVKPSLLLRVARMTGATILTSTDHVTSMGQHAHKALGLCQHFQVVSYPGVCDEHESSCKHGCSCCCARGHRTGHVSYVYLTGCPRALGCTIVLRGTTRQRLKKVKHIVRLVTFIAYHLRLECAYFNDSNATLSSAAMCGPLSATFSSLPMATGCRTVSHNLRQGPGKDGLMLTQVCAHQLMLVTTLWMSLRSQCAPVVLRGIMCYSEQDTCLGEYLVDSCFTLDSKYSHDKKSVNDLVQLFYHNNGCVAVSVVKVDHYITTSSGDDLLRHGSLCDEMIHTWSFCKRCNCIVTPVERVTTDAWKMSFGKFLEIYFYNSGVECCTSGCRHNMRDDMVKCFGMHNLVARFEYQPIHPYAIRMRRSLPFDRDCYYRELRHQHQELRLLTLRLFAAFEEKVGQLQAAVSEAAGVVQKAFLLRTNEDHVVTSTEMLIRAVDTANVEVHRTAQDIQNGALYLGRQMSDELERPANKPILGRTGIEVISFPSQYRRELYAHATKLNRRCSLLGQIVCSLRDSSQLCSTAMCDGLSSPSNVDAAVWSHINLLIQELQQLQDDMYTSKSASCHHAGNEYLEETTSCDGDRDDCNDYTEPSSCTGHNSHLWTPEVPDDFKRAALDSGKHGFNVVNTNGVEVVTTASVLTAAVTLDAEDACALSCRHVESVQTSPSHGNCLQSDSRLSVTPTVVRWDSCSKQHTSSSRRSYKISNALARFLGKECIQQDPWMVQLGDLQVGGLTTDSMDQGDVQVHEEQPTTVIAYSLNTVYYKRAVEAHASLIDSYCSQEENVAYCGLTPLKDGAEADFMICNTEALVRCDRPFHDLRSAKHRAWVKAIASISRTALELPLSALKHGALSPDVGSPRERVSNQASICKESRSSPGGLHKECVGGDCNDTIRSTAVSYTVEDSRLSLSLSFRRSCSEHSHGTPTQSLAHATPAVYVATKLEKAMLTRTKTHIKHRFADVDEKGSTLCKFVCHAYWATQFAAVRQAYFQGDGVEEELGFLRSLAMARPWNAQGGKSGATFLKTTDGRFVVKQITRTELQMFIEYAPAYFEYLSKTFFHGYATLLVKVLGVYQIGSHNRVNGKKLMEQVVVMQNLFHERTIHHVFDLKGSTRSRYTRVIAHEQHSSGPPNRASRTPSTGPAHSQDSNPVLLDENFLEFTHGRPLPLQDQAKAYFDNAVLNDTLFLSLINVVDYSILVGINHTDQYLIVGIIDYMRQYDIIKKVERMGKSVGMIAGQAEPTVIQPPNYRNRFQTAMSKYFMMVPNRWTACLLEQLDNSPPQEIWAASDRRGTDPRSN